MSRDICSMGLLGARLAPAQPGTTPAEPPTRINRAPPGSSKTLTRSIDRDLWPLRELLVSLLIASWCLLDLQSSNMKPPEPQHLILRAFAMQT